jgi:hypothetical protein
MASAADGFVFFIVQVELAHLLVWMANRRFAADWMRPVRMYPLACRSVHGQCRHGAIRPLTHAALALSGGRQWQGTTEIQALRRAAHARAADPATWSMACCRSVPTCVTPAIRVIPRWRFIRGR